MPLSPSLPASCSRHHYWTRLRAWVSGQQYFHGCNPVVPHGGDITWTSVGRTDGRPWIDDLEIETWYSFTEVAPEAVVHSSVLPTEGVIYFKGSDE